MLNFYYALRLKAFLFYLSFESHKKLLISLIANALKNFASVGETFFITFILLQIKNHPFIQSLPFCSAIHASKDSNILTDISARLACKRIFLFQFFS